MTDRRSEITLTTGSEARNDPMIPLIARSIPIKPTIPITANSARKYNLSMIDQFQRTETSTTVYSMWTVIHPNSPWKKTWDIILIFLLFYVATVMPYRVAFIDGTLYDTWWYADSALNGLFFIDFLVNCCLAYYDDYSHLVYDHRRILWNYLKKWMLIDIVSCLPMDLLLASSSSGGGGKYNNLLRLFRLPRLYRLLRISKIFKLMQQYKNSQVLIRIQEFLNIKQSVAKLIGVFFMVLLCVHIFACLWAFLPKLENYPLLSWVIKGGHLGNDQYLISLYWCFVTFSTVGYGEVTPGTSAEFIVAIIWMLFGICFYAFIIGSLASILSSLETK